MTLQKVQEVVRISNSNVYVPEGILEIVTLRVPEPVPSSERSPTSKDSKALVMLCRVATEQFESLSVPPKPPVSVPKTPTQFAVEAQKRWNPTL